MNGHLPKLGGEPTTTTGVISSQQSPVPDNKFVYQGTGAQKASIVKSTTVPQTLFTPYALNSITRVNTQVLPGSSQCSSRESPHDNSHSAQSNTSNKPLQNTQPPRVKHSNSNSNHNNSASPVNASPGSLNSVNHSREGRSSVPAGVHHQPYQHSPIISNTTDKV